ncbi:unnamed protein product [Menidia menidia]|uniref:(Atlantic silverside) hypothetical protein n=1 Tax=Menidia menidia TaxID=238744 RepID=A0A8S4AQH7_9TELE|nr:unnamed protein product [Menidia menidia]
MREDGDNPLALSSKRSPRDQTGYGRELERLQADLEVEKTRTLWAWGQLGVELRHLREEAEKEHRRVLREVAARRGSQKDSRRRRYLLAKEAAFQGGGRRSEVESTGEKAGGFCGGQTKLEQLLLTLYDKISADPAAYKLHQRQEFELEKAIFLCHLLDAHGKLLEGTRRVGSPGHVAKSTSRMPAEGVSSSPCQVPPVLSSPKRKSKEVRRRHPSDKVFPAAAPCIAATVRDAAHRIHPPHVCPHADRDSQPSSWTESSWSDESSSSKCMQSNMEPPSVAVSAASSTINRQPTSFQRHLHGNEPRTL